MERGGIETERERVRKINYYSKENEKEKITAG